jgi:hypothetical protein
MIKYGTFEILSKLKLRYRYISPFLFRTVTFLGQAQRSKPGSEFAKAGPDGKGSAMAHMKEMLTRLASHHRETRSIRGYLIWDLW